MKLIEICKKTVQMKVKFIPILILLQIALQSCNDSNKLTLAKNVLGYAPIYESEVDATKIEKTTIQKTENAGKIYVYGNYTFQIENGKGIHIIESADPSNAKKIAFLAVPGCSEISIKSNQLFTNNYRDLVSINISNINSISVSNRIKNIFPEVSQLAPPYGNTFFECPDPQNGKIIGWKEKQLEEAKCKTQ